MADQFEGWGKLLALAQKHKTKAELRAAITASGLLIHETEPLSGYYRCAAVKDGPLLPVAIWREGGTLHVFRNNEPVALERVWPYCAWNPIPYEWYEGAVERGEKWPDAADIVIQPGRATLVEAGTVVGDVILQAPAEEDEATKLEREIKTAKQVAEKVYAVVNSDEEAAAAQSARSTLNTLSGTADKHREALNRPHLDQTKKNNEKWMPLVKLAKAGADDIRGALKVWENKKLAAERVAQEAAAAAAQPAVPTLDGDTVTTTHNNPPEPIAQPVVALVPAPTTSHIKGASGRAARVEMVKVATVVDQDAAYMHLRAIPEIKEAIRKVAQRMVDAGHTVPGVDVHEERDVA